MSTVPLVTIYSDGGTRPNPGPGGYGVILKYKGIQKDISRGYACTTNNRMELMGAIAGLKELKVKSEVMIFLDSQYVINGISKGWATKWRANNWFRTGSQKAINADLWEELLLLIEKHKVHLKWIKGHNGHIENELCDEMATLAMQAKNLAVDVGFMKDNKEYTSHPKQKTIGNILSESRSDRGVSGEKIGVFCRKCNHELLKKIPKHTKKTLEKAYYYEYYHYCPNCETNFMLEKAKRDIKNLKI